LLFNENRPLNPGGTKGIASLALFADVAYSDEVCFSSSAALYLVDSAAAAVLIAEVVSSDILILDF